MLTLLLLLQAAPVTASEPGPQRWSILTPAPEPECPKSASGEIVVCDGTATSQHLPLPDLAEPGATPHGVNPLVTGTGALAADGTPCAATQKGCTIGVGPPILPLAKAALGVVKSAFAKKPDKTGRIPIKLD